MDPFDLYPGIEVELKKDGFYLTEIVNSNRKIVLQDLIDISVDLFRASFTIESMRSQHFVLEDLVF